MTPERRYDQKSPCPPERLPGNQTLTQMEHSTADYTTSEVSDVAVLGT
ncbi:hypothetical protein EV192_108333 [Actinocrispum wychmicini]|uniref:Uncharacterized protein n=1 Tax=Actinocrispum wychmicini TaxID=1213861 RepID=A0A4R2JLI1_9PSEU|nr:hypothetical protein EV192_108333 [Actinocrispum wychmicini]